MAPDALAVGAFLVLALSPAGWVGFALLCGALATAWLGGRPEPLATSLPARILLAAGVLAHAAPGAARWPLAATGAVLLGSLAAERVLRTAARPQFRVAHLPPLPDRSPVLSGNQAVWLANAGLILISGLLAALRWPVWPVLVPAAGAAALTGGLLVAAVARWRNRHRAALAALRSAVERHDPRFLLYFSAPPGSGYQATMWLPHLERIGEPFLVVLPETDHLPEISAATRAPVIAYRSFAALDALMVPGLRAAFYVNNGMKNAHCVRYVGLTHVQLYHGDSDKAVTSSPVTAMFDRIFVAGQAGIDRFAANGVHIPPEKFRIVGRPQVADLEVAAGHIGDVTDQVVLYAPTWASAYADANHCSLPIAETIVRGLLDHGVTVILRPHPYTSRDPRSRSRLRRVEQLLAADRERSGRAHRWGAAAATRSTLYDCMNAAHAMVCDISSVASDFLYTGKPLALTDMTGAGAAVTGSFPIARGTYLLRPDAGNLAEVVDDLLRSDPLAGTRREVRVHYLGDAPPDRYVETFLAEARTVVGTSEDSAAPESSRNPAMRASSA